MTILTTYHTTHKDIRILDEERQTFRKEAVEIALKRINRGKTEEQYGLNLETVEVFLANEPLFILLLNSFLRKGYFLKAWKRANLVFFNNEGKDKDIPSSYWPICLLNLWGSVRKIFDTETAIPSAYYKTSNGHVVWLHLKGINNT